MNTSSPQSVIAIYAEDKPGLLGQVLNLFNRPRCALGSLNVARTDVSDIVLITLEAEVSGQTLTSLLNKLRKIVEVYTALAWPAAGLAKIGYYRVAQAMPVAELNDCLAQNQAVVTALLEDSLVIRKTGTAAGLKQLYDQLDGTYLISYCESGLIAEQSLLQLDELFLA